MNKEKIKKEVERMIKTFSKQMLKIATNRKNIEKGDSWKNSSILFLRNKKREEDNEFFREEDFGKAMDELIDGSIVNMMLWFRLRELKEKGEEL